MFLDNGIYSIPVQIIKDEFTKPEQKVWTFLASSPQMVFDLAIKRGAKLFEQGIKIQAAFAAVTLDRAI